MAGKYLHPYKHYADLYGVAEVSIKRYAQRGLPLDDPDAMGEHLSTRGRKPDHVDETPGDDDEDAVGRLFQPGPEFYEGQGLTAEIRRLNILAKEASKQLGDALASNNARERQNRIAEYLQIVEALRKIEKEHPGILLQNEKAILISEVEDGLTRLLLAIVERLRTIPTRGMQVLPGLDAIEVREELEREVELALDPIRSCAWLPEEHRPKDLTPKEAPASEEKPRKSAKKTRKKKP